MEHSIGRWTSIIYRYGQVYVSKKMEGHNIGSGQFVILLTLFRESGISQERLSDFLKIDKGSIAKSIKKLEEEGYVAREVDQEDKRAYKVSLTQKGLAVIPKVQAAIKSWEDFIVADLDENEKKMLERLMHRIANKAGSFKASVEETEE